MTIAGVAEPGQWPGTWIDHKSQAERSHDAEVDKNPSSCSAS